ncbi:MAG: phosphatidate cytidylyltransferase [Actinomycetes bacterium]|jgi:phosphatidate cytidylyltransferase
MDDIHSINEAINKKAGRKLIPSILVSLSILAVVFGTIIYIPILFGVFIWFAIMLAIREIVHAYKQGGIELPEFPLQLAGTALLVSAWYGRVSGLAVAIAICIPNLLVYLLVKTSKDFIKRSTAATFAIFYIPFLAGFILLLAHHEDGAARIFALVVLVSCNDTFAYIFGVLFGKHPLAPHISPKKTWEGLIGALIATTVGSALVFHFSLHSHWWLGALIGVMAVVTATCGDLIESAVKRDLAIKDMGAILPGHGGILDRIDSVLFTGPAVWFVLELIKHFNL